MSVAARSTAGPPARSSARSAASRPRHPTTFRVGQRLLAFDLLSPGDTWRYAQVVHVYNDRWDERRAHVPPPPADWVELAARPKQVRVHFIGWFDLDDCDVLMCDVPHRLDYVEHAAARRVKQDEFDTANHNACSNCLEGGSDGGPATGCCERCPRVYHPDCLKFIDRQMGMREEDRALREGEWVCTWCRHPGLRSMMDEEATKNKIRRAADRGRDLMWWDEQREEEELKPPYGPARFHQFVAEEYIRDKIAGSKSRKKKGSRAFYGERRRRKPQRRQRSEQQQPQQQQARQAEEKDPQPVAPAAAGGHRQLEDRATEDDQKEAGNDRSTVSAAVDSLPFLVAQAVRVANEVGQQAERLTRRAQYRRPISAVRPPSRGQAVANKRVRKTEEVDMLDEEDDEAEAAEGAAQMEESCGSDSGLGDLDTRLLLSGDYTPLSSSNGVSDAETGSPTSPSLPSMSPPHAEAMEDSEHELHDGDRRPTAARSLTPTRSRVGDGCKHEAHQAQVAQQGAQQQLKAPPSVSTMQLPANFVLSPAPHAVKAERNSNNTPQSHPASSTVPDSATSMPAAAAVSSTPPPVSDDPASLSKRRSATLSSTAIALTRRTIHHVDEIVIDDSDDEQPMIADIAQPQPAGQPTPPVVPPTASSRSSLSDASFPPSLSVSASSSATSLPRPPPPTGTTSSFSPAIKSRPQIRTSASPSLLSSLPPSTVPSSSASPPSWSSSAVLPSVSVSRPSVPASLSAPCSSSSPVSSSASVSSSSRYRSNRPASYSQKSVSRTGPMRSVRAAVQVQGGSLQLSFAADSRGGLRVDGLDLTKPQQLRIGETIIELPPLVQQTANAGEAAQVGEESSSLATLRGTPPAPHAGQDHNPQPALSRPAPVIDHAQRAAASSSLPPPAPTAELDDAGMDEDTGASIGQSSSPRLFSDDVSPSSLRSAHVVGDSQPSAKADRGKCCLCNHPITNKAHPPPPLAELAALGHTDGLPYPQHARACGTCTRFVQLGRLPHSMAKGRNTDNCALCNRVISSAYHRRHTPTLQLAELGYNQPPPHPVNLYTCASCYYSVRFRKRLPHCIDNAAPAADNSSDAASREENCAVRGSSTARCSSTRLSLPPQPPALFALSSSGSDSSSPSPLPMDIDARLDTEAEMMDDDLTQSASPAVPSISTCESSVLAFPSGPRSSSSFMSTTSIARSALPDSATATSGSALQLSSDFALASFSSPTSSCSSSPSPLPSEIEAALDAEVTMVQSASPTAALSTPEVRVRASPQPRLKGGNQSEFDRDVEQLQTAPTRQKRTRKPPNRYAWADSDRSSREEDQDNSGKEGARSKRRALCAWDAQQDQLLVQLKVAGKSFEEIGQAMHRGVPAMKRRLHQISHHAVRQQQGSAGAGEEEADSSEVESDSEAAEDEDDDELIGDRVWGVEQDRQLLELEAEGRGCREIGRMMGNRSRQAVKSRLYRLRHGLTDRKSHGEKGQQVRGGAEESSSRAGGRPRLWTAERDKQLMALVDDGYSHDRIAAEMELTAHAVHNRVKRLAHKHKASVADGEVSDDAMRNAATRPPARQQEATTAAKRFPYDAQTDQRLMELKAAGRSWREMGEAMGRSMASVKGRWVYVNQHVIGRLGAKLGQSSPSHTTPRQHDQHDGGESQLQQQEEDASPTDQRVWSAVQDRRIVALADEGKRSDEIARMLGNKSRQAVTARLSALRKEERRHHGNGRGEKREAPPNALKDGTWDRIARDAPLSWLTHAQQYRAAKQQLAAQEQKDGDAESRHASTRQLSLAARPLLSAAHSELLRLRNQVEEDSQEKKVEYERNQHADSTTVAALQRLDKKQALLPVVKQYVERQNSMELLDSWIERIIGVLQPDDPPPIHIVPVSLHMPDQVVDRLPSHIRDSVRAIVHAFNGENGIVHNSPRRRDLSESTAYLGRFSPDELQCLLVALDDELSELELSEEQRGKVPHPQLRDEYTRSEVGRALADYELELNVLEQLKVVEQWCAAASEDDVDDGQSLENFVKVAELLVNRTLQ